MARYLAPVLMLTLLCAARPAEARNCEQQKPPQRADERRTPSAEAKPNEPERWKWWLHPDSRKELRLTEQQSTKINEVWESTAPKLRERWHELEKLEDALAKVLQENTTDVSIVSQQIEKVERLRAEHTAMRNIMIYRMRQLLTPEQRIKVDAIRAKMDEDRKRREEERKRQGKDAKY
jgi:Spy/CpxP family protein refolding chaperone